MKIIIMSDSHGNTNNINYILKNYEYDYLFHLGDGLSDLVDLADSNKVKFVKGNCDFFSHAPSELIVKINNFKFLLVHGHTYNVKKGLGALINYAKELKVNYVLFGHTHKVFNEIIEEITFLNPGSLSNIRGGKSSFMVLDATSKKTLTHYVEF